MINLTKLLTNIIQYCVFNSNYKCKLGIHSGDDNSTIHVKVLSELSNNRKICSGLV